MSRSAGPILLSLTVTALLMSACERSAPVEPPTTQADTPAIEDEPNDRGNAFVHADWRPSPDPSRLVVAELTFDKPATWIESPPITSMRHANFSVPGRRGADAGELAVFVLPTTEPPAFDDLVAQWQALFEPDADGLPPSPLPIELSSAETRIPVVRIDGSYRRTGSAWYTPGQAMLAAAMPANEGLIVLRLAGPVATIDAEQDRFLAMLQSGREMADGGQSDGSGDR